MLFKNNWKIAWYSFLQLCDYSNVALLSRHVDFKTWYHCQIIKIFSRIVIAIVKNNRCQSFDNVKVLQFVRFAHVSNAIISKKNKSIVIEINFKFHENFIYHIKNDVFKFCISNNFQKNVFKIVHDDNFHVEQNKVYRQLTKTIYISSFFKKLRFYLRHCSKCQFN